MEGRGAGVAVEGLLKSLVEFGCGTFELVSVLADCPNVGSDFGVLFGGVDGKTAVEIVKF
jgi:hypothetical protein